MPFDQVVMKKGFGRVFGKPLFSVSAFQQLNVWSLILKELNSAAVRGVKKIELFVWCDELLTAE